MWPEDDDELSGPLARLRCRIQIRMMFALIDDRYCDSDEEAQAVFAGPAPRTLGIEERGERAIRLLSETVIGADSGGEVVEWGICFGEMQVNERVSFLPCGCTHVYHRDEIEEWLRHNPTCPSCRREPHANDHTETGEGQEGQEGG